MKRIYLIIPVFILCIQFHMDAQAVKDTYASSSVLSSGTWFKMALTRDGVYRIDYSTLKQLGIPDPSKVRIYANNFGQLSYLNDDPKPDDLTEIALYTETGADGIFNQGDYLLFYGEGTGKWKYNTASGDFDYKKHYYSDTAFYFITSGSMQGKRISAYKEPEEAPDFFSSESDALFIHEIDNENLIKSGREWYQQVSSLVGTSINPEFSDLVPGEKIRVRIRVLARAPVSTIFRFCEGSTVDKNIQVQPVNLYAYTGTYANISDSSFTTIPLSTAPKFEVRYFNNGESSAWGWLDFVRLRARKNNIFSGQISFFRDSRSAGPGRITEFSIRSLSGNPFIWDITDPADPRRVSYLKNGDYIKFKASTDSLKSYVLFTETNYLTPLIRPGSIPNQDLHGSDPADMVIVTHPEFKAYAEELASFHLSNSGLTSQIVIPEEIYNEFSGGVPDIAAIRNFARMKYLEQAGTQHPLRYLLLFGDGSYENKTPPPRNPNFIPTYQTQNSNVIVSSFTSDDFYGLLEDGEGEAEGSLDIGIGRLPVSDTSQARIVVNKIKRYMDPSNHGDWKNIICITADDEDGNTHMSDAEGLYALLKDSVKSFNVDKIYLDAFKQVTSINGQSYPDVEKAINNRINSGCLIFNYIGHGSENGLAHERVVKTDDINSWKNGTRLPLFITATCEFSRFDDMEKNILTGDMPGKTSAGEMVLLNENGGGIALMSTTRVVYSSPNYFLNKNIYNYAFDRDAEGNALRLGDIIRLAKNNSGSGSNKRNFSLLGDPAVILAYPWHGQVVTDSINHVSITGGIDSLKALSQVTVSGHIENTFGSLLTDFNGIVTPVVYDKVSSIRTLANDGGSTMKFDLRNNILFSGKTKAVNGNFTFTFIVPRDIDYSYGTGKIIYYANDSSRDMNGNFSDIIVGGFAETAIIDTTGPDISLFMNDTLFRNGGITDNNPRMLAILEDKGGINTTGSGIGHDIVAYLDNDRNKSFVLNSYFENDFDNYMKGKITYDLSGLTEGSHYLTIKAWDNFNNSSEKTILFLVEINGKFMLKHLFNYPNPILNETKISAEHNRPDEELDVTVTIYNMSGSAIRIIKTTIYSTGYQLSPIVWDGNSESGQRAGRGIYPYRISVRTGSGEIATASGRMIIL
jgi:Peptidase family C25